MEQVLAPLGSDSMIAMIDGGVARRLHPRRSEVEPKFLLFCALGVRTSMSRCQEPHSHAHLYGHKYLPTCPGMGQCRVWLSFISR